MPDTPDLSVLSVPKDLSNSSSAQPLPPTIQHQFESNFGQDLSDVRVHVGHAPTLLGGEGAKAFSVGSDIFFKAGEYHPHEAQGGQLLGHELTHVIQQRQGRTQNEAAEE